MTRALRFGLQVPQDTADPGLLREIAQTAERCGYHSLWLNDHFYHYPSPANVAALEPFTLMAWLAAWTKTIRIGTLVLCDAYRPPALTAKMAACFDVLSGGRLEFGYGAGWYREEFGGYGYEFPPVAVRIAKMEEALAIIKLLWRRAQATFNGRYYQVVDAICEPKPVQQPHPPITIGGGGERLLLRAVARHADIWNYFPVPLRDYERKLAVLKEHCARVERDPATLGQSLVALTVTASWEKEVRDQLEGARQRGVVWARGDHVVQGTPDIVVPRFRDYARLGVSLFVVVLPDPYDLKQIEFVADEVIAELG